MAKVFRFIEARSAHDRDRASWKSILGYSRNLQTAGDLTFDENQEGGLASSLPPGKKEIKNRESSTFQLEGFLVVMCPLGAEEKKMLLAVMVLLLAYLLGSVPTAFWVSRVVVRADIRHMGDRNMSARIVSRTLSVGPGVPVDAVDFAKGTLAVLLAQSVTLPLGWQMAAGTCAVLGHDFPVFAGFRRGQGSPPPVACSWL
jgi:hypothetical protein